MGASKRSAPQATSASTGGTQRASNSCRFEARLTSSAGGGAGWFKTMPATASPSPKAVAATSVCSVALIVPRALRATITSGRPSFAARSPLYPVSPSGDISPPEPSTSTISDRSRQ